MAGHMVHHKQGRTPGHPFDAKSQLTGFAVQGKMILVPACSPEVEEEDALPLGVTGNTPDSSGT